MKKFRRLAALLLAGVLALAVLSGCGGSRFEREVEETVLKYVNAAIRDTLGEGAREFKNDPALRQKAYELLGRIDPESGLIDSQKAVMVIEERRWYRGFKRWEFKLPTVWIDRERTSSRYLTCMLS